MSRVPPATLTFGDLPQPQRFPGPPGLPKLTELGSLQWIDPLQPSPRYFVPCVVHGSTGLGADSAPIRGAAGKDTAPYYLGQTP